MQVLDVIADAAHAELAEVGEVLADLRRVEVELLGQRLRRDGLDAGRLELVEAARDRPTSRLVVSSETGSAAVFRLFGEFTSY